MWMWIGGGILKRSSSWVGSSSDSDEPPSEGFKLADEASTKGCRTGHIAGAVMSTFWTLIPATCGLACVLVLDGVKGVMRFRICRIKNKAIYTKSISP
jgi:hypothetical protein